MKTLIYLNFSEVVNSGAQEKQIQTCIFIPIVFEAVLSIFFFIFFFERCCKSKGET